jgi:hypothetical protein
MWFWLKGLIISIITPFVLWYFGLFETDEANLRSALGIVAQVSITMVGFVLAALAILATIAHTKALKNLAKTGHYSFLTRRMSISMVLFGLLAAVCLVFIFVHDLNAYLAFASVYIASLCVYVFVDVINKFMILLDVVNPKSSESLN